MAKYRFTGEYLRAARRNKNLTQADLAKALGMHVQYISNFERGLVLPPKRCLKKLNRILILNYGYLYDSLNEDHINLVESQMIDWGFYGDR